MAKHSDKESDFQERWGAQLRKGTVEMAVLASLWGRRLYGLEILRNLASDAQLSLGEGTIYPILNRLKKEGLLVSEWVEAEAGHPRKYYSLTEAGRERLCSMAHSWVGFSRGLGCLLAPVLEDRQGVREMTDRQKIQQYLSAFCDALASTPEPQNGDFVREIAAHIRDAAEEPGATVSAVLVRLGPAEVLAGQYTEGELLRTARRSLSPLLLLRAALRLATKGVLGIVVFSCAVSGYLAGVGMILSALAKPFFPSDIGMWRSTSQGLAAGLVAASAQSTHELLRWWYIPVALSMGVALILVTTFLVRGCLRISSLADGLGPRLTAGLAITAD